MRKRPHYDERRHVNKRRPPSSHGSSGSVIPNAANYRVSGKTETLLDMKSRMLTSDLFFWDKSPRNYENTNVRALKLFGLATPQTDFETQEIPPDFERFQNVRSISTAMSAIFRTLDRKVYPTLTECALAVVAKRGIVERPLIVNELLRQLATSNARPEGIDSHDAVLLSKTTVVYPNSAARHPSFSQALSIKRTVCLDENSSASELAFKPARLPESVWLLYSFPPRHDVKCVVEVLNAFPMSHELESHKDRVEALIRERCQQAGVAASRVETVLRPPYELPRVFIELLSDDQCVMLAERLGKMKIEGRSLVTTVSYERVRK